MQVKFHKVTFKNLLSYGNAETVVELDSVKNTIITAKNGHGKSSIIEAIFYALYGKPFRNIKIGQLINSINRKALLVTIEFSVGSDSYKVVRGQKPTVFEIYKNNELVLEDAASKDYQAYLETKVIGINYKTFKQIVIIGKANYVPFMSLSAAERRNITEEVLDISIFSNMLELAKQKVSEHKSSIDALTYEIALTKNQIESQKELLDTLTKEASVKSVEIAKQRVECEARIKELATKLNLLDTELESYANVTSKYDALVDSKSKIDLKIAKIDQKIATLDEELKFYHQDKCPTCTQTISDELRKQRESEQAEKKSALIDLKTQSTDLLNTFKEKLNSIVKDVQAQRRLMDERTSVFHELRSEERRVVTLVETDVTDSIDLCKLKLKELVDTIVRKTDEKNVASKEHLHYKASVDILRDNGIKSKIIATFIPLINQLINEYLQKFDLFIEFELDESFNETIKSRNRDAFSYNSFSEGEKTKIDLSIIMAWRHIAMTRNSISTNLLIFDEILDQSLDDTSVDTFVDILSSIEAGVNALVISHRNLIPEMFDRHIKVEKVRDFSILTSY